MITDARVLQPEFIPGEVKHRDAEVSHLSDTLRPVTSGDHPDPSFLYGPSGAGKTCIARYTVQQLRDTPTDIERHYVNCWEDYSRFKLLYCLLDGIGQATDIHRQSTPRDKLLDRLRDYDGPHYVAILDEVDQLRDKDVLYDLYRTQNLTMILIANREEDVFGVLDERLNSRLQSCARIRFDRYGLSELVEILRDRVYWGLEPDTVSHENLELIADHAAGNAHVAIGVLRNAARMATRGEHDTITREVIRKAVSETKAELRDRTTDKLTHHQQVLYEIICDHDEINGGNLYEKYTKQVSEPKTKRTMRNYLKKLQQYDLITTHGQTRGRSYRPAQ